MFFHLKDDKIGDLVRSKDIEDDVGGGNCNANEGGKLIALVLLTVQSSFLASCSSKTASKDGSCDTVRKESPKACLMCCISRPALELLLRLREREDSYFLNTWLND